MKAELKISGFRDVNQKIKQLNVKIKSLQKVIEPFVGKLKDEMEAKSPVGQFGGGTYKKSWVVSYPTRAGKLAKVVFSNTQPYTGPIELGVTPGEKPWPSVSDKESVKRKGKLVTVGGRTVEYKGRIYSSQAPGGVAQPVLEKNLGKIYKLINNHFGIS